jgi:hypothetical protein
MKAWKFVSYSYLFYAVISWFSCTNASLMRSRWHVPLLRLIFTASNTSGRLLCLDFDNSYLLNGLYASLTNIIVDYFGFHGRSAYFNGNSASIEIPALSNVQFKQFGISLWFRRVGNDSGIQGLVHNGDCRQLGSIHVYSLDQSDVSARLTTIYQNASIGAQHVSYTIDYRSECLHVTKFRLIRHQHYWAY